MTSPTPATPSPVSDDDLLHALNLGGTVHARGRRVVGLRREPGPYYSSHRLEDLVVRLDDGAELPLVFKDLSADTLPADARRVKPAFLREPAREPWAYRVLEAHGVDAPRCVAHHADAATGRRFLFLEKAPGAPLWQAGEADAWHAAARWLAAAHGRLAPVARSGDAGPLLRYTRDYYENWRDRVEELVLRPATSADVRLRRLARVVADYARVIDRLTRLPATMIHGEFHASNILVDRTPGGPRVYPVDWETAALAPGLMDVADLTAGNWTEAQRASLAAAYRSALPADLAPPPGEFDAALDACRLHKAMQWLGWAADWSPPREHRQDWLAEALRLADKLVLAT